jgi:hypothetical protein
VIGLVGVAALALAACGSDSSSDTPSADDVDEAVDQVVSDPTDDAGSSESADGDTTETAQSVDLAPIVSCIEAADIVTAPTTFGDDFLAEQGIVAALGLGAMGIEFGGGSLYFFETVERAEEQAANFVAVGDDAVVRDGTVVVQYASAVQDEAAAIVLDCAT